MKRSMLLAYAFAIVDNTIMMMKMQRLAYVVNDLKIDPAGFGTLQTIFGIVQLIGGLIFGQLCDTLGLRICMAIVAVSGCVSYLLMSAAQNFTGLALSMAACIFFQGMQGTQTILAKSTTPEERATAFSRGGLTFALGSIVGPAISGALTGVVTSSTIFGCAGVIYLLFAPIFLVFLPDLKAPKDAGDHKQEKKLLDVAIMRDVASKPVVFQLLALKAIGIGSFFFLDAVFTLYLIERFQISTRDNANYGIYIGVWIAIMNGLGLPKLQTVFDKITLLRAGCIGLLYVFFWLQLFTQYWQLYLIMPGIPIGMTMIGTITDTLLTNAVSANESGTVLGLAFACVALVMAIAPSISGYVMNAYGFSAIGSMGVAFSVLALALTVGLQGRLHRHTD